VDKMNAQLGSDACLLISSLKLPLHTNNFSAYFLCSVRRSVSEWLELHRRPHSAERDKDMAARVTILSRFLPEPVKAQEFLTKFSVHLTRDTALLQGMETIVRPDISCKDCADTTVGRDILMVEVIFHKPFGEYTYVFSCE
jgi:hypothetical protein